MPDWGAFAGFLAVITLLVVLLARSTQQLFEGAAGSESVVDGESLSASAGVPHTDDSESHDTELDDDSESDDADTVDAEATDAEAVDADADDPTDHHVHESRTTPLGDFHPSRGFRYGEDPLPPDLTLSGSQLRAVSGPIDFSPGELLANVVLSHGLFGVFLLGAVAYTRVPASALGIAVPTPAEVGLGVGFGVLLWGLSEGGARWLDVSGIERSERLRQAMTPASVGGWLTLYLVVLPLVAGFEELLFRGAMIGALSVGFDVSPWLLALGSSALFAAGHGAQGPAGVLVTGVLGLVLAAGFVATGSLTVVLIAHYVVNALEFGVHELGPQLGGSRESASR